MVHGSPSQPEHRLLGQPLEADGVMRHVLVKVGEDQQQFQHAVSLSGVWHVGAFFQVFHNCQRVGEKPFETG